MLFRSMTREKTCVVVDHGKYTSVLWGGNLKTDPEKFPFTWFAWLYRPGAEKALFYATGNDKHNTERRMIQAISAQNQIEALQMKETTCGTTC